MATIQDFINSLGLDRTAVGHGVKTVADTAQKNKWNLGQFGQNAAKDASALAQFAATLINPLDRNNPLNIVATRPQDVGTETEKFLKNTGAGLNKMAGEPVNPQTGNLQMPSAEKIVQSAYEAPVSTWLAFTPLKATKGKGAPVVTDPPLITPKKPVGKPATVIDASPIPQPISKDVSTGNNMVTKKKVPPEKIASYNAVFEIPRAVSQRMRVKPEQVIGQLLEDIPGGVKNIDELDNVAKNVTGEAGAFPTINRIILNDLKDPLDYSIARETAIKVPEKYLSKDAAVLDDVMREIDNALPQYDIMSKVPDNAAYATHLFDATQALDRVANMYKRKAYTAMGDLTHPALERAANAVQEVSNNIKDVLDGAVPPEIYQRYKTDPRVLEQLDRVPLPIRERYLANAKQFRDGRSIQSPYVALQEMIDHTKDASLASFSKWTKQMQEQPRSQAVAQGTVQAVVNTPAAVAGVAQKGLEKLASRFDKTPEQLMQERTAATLPLIPNAGLPIKTRIKNVARKTGVALPPIAAIQGVGATQLPAIPKDEPSSPDAGKGAFTGAGVKSQPGAYAVESPQEQGIAMDVQKYQEARNKILSIIEQQKLNNPQAAADSQAKLNVLDSNFELQKPLVEAYTKTNQTLGQANRAYEIAKNASPELWQGVGLLNNIRKSTDPKYAELLGAIQYLNKTTGVDLASSKTKDVLLGNLNAAASIAINEYNAVLQQNIGGNTLNAGTEQTNIPPIPQQPPATEQVGQPINYNFDFGSAGVGMPQ